MLMRACIIALGLFPGIVLGSARSAEPMPAGIGIRMTIVGPAFVDARGMTLYQQLDTARVAYWDRTCSDRPVTVRPLQSVAYNQVEEFPMLVPNAASWRSCAEKYPPLLAPAAAKSIGHWSIHRRENGMLQWAYRGSPLHRSIKDQMPGQINGWSPQDRNVQVNGWSIAAAPLGVPPGIETRLTSVGLVLANHEGKPLYHAVIDGKATPSENWKPVLAPAATIAQRLPADWSIARRSGGVPQWAWKGKPLYTYAQDAGDDFGNKLGEQRIRFVDIFGDIYGQPLAGWQAAVIKPASAPPAGVRVKPAYPDFGRTNRIYADAEGKTLYAIHCAEFTDRLDCDDIGDSPRYWLSFCGGEERCRRDWKPFAAPKNARPVDGLWAVSLINPSHPFKALKEGEEGLAIWTYRGRPVFTFAEDQTPRDSKGEFDFHSTTMTGVPIYAFGVTVDQHLDGRRVQ